ncbi:hypothetical protein OESDEN_11339 [Oesophagostomum dentatum]|uniref:E3 ubiquitin-protein ligase SHPRH first helical domain-containing protein n=1 Tax=Oesophagostomum dentatum TaxID=61180 RepID=A0A0B1SY63_OESDE|nr:hypothetical protein OESDEN_11339 [Oesophagostomum dentatum]
MFSPKLIFRKLFEDARTAVVQRHREMVANRNALAGIYLLLGEHHHALSWYRQAFLIREQQKELNKLLGLTEVVNENQEEIKEVLREDEEVVELKQDEHDNDDEDKELDISKPIKPLEIDALQIIHITRRGKAWHELILIRMYRSCKSEVMTVVHPFYELLLKWLTLMEKMLRIGREITTYVQEWVNRE